MKQSDPHSKLTIFNQAKKIKDKFENFARELRIYKMWYNFEKINGNCGIETYLGT